MSFMNKIFLSLFFVGLLCAGTALTQNKQSLHKVKTTHKTTKMHAQKENKDSEYNIPHDGSTRVKIFTDSGTIIVKLYDSTVLHRDNFVKLVKEGFFDSLLFHRIIPQFMIQGGDPTSKYAQPGEMLGSGGGDMERIPAEFHQSYIHKKGALAAARDGNPQKASSACQFYLVEGKVITPAELDMIEQQKGFKYTPEQRKIYTTIGGTPFLDQDYTVFGEIEHGFDVVHKIIKAPRDSRDRPLGDIRMKIELLTPATKQ